MNKFENCFNSFDFFIIIFIIYNFYSLKIIRIFFFILKRIKKVLKVYYFKIIVVDDLLFKEIERGINLVISILNKVFFFIII